MLPLTLTCLKQRDVYLFHDLNMDIQPDAFVLLKDKMKELADHGALVLFLTENNMIVSDFSYKPGEYFSYTNEWNVMAGQCRELKTKQTLADENNKSE